MNIVNACRAVVEHDESFSRKSVELDKSANRTLNHRDLTKKKDVKEFSAEKFVENLLKEGSKLPCDETSDTFNNNATIPAFYDEDMFKKGQGFFHKHIFGLFFSELLGILTLLSMELTTKILVMTNMSSTDMTAYKRYMATIFHMCLWYDHDFRPGSRSWASITKIRNLHNSASKRSSSCLKYRITQKDMALTQFGFMGFGLVRSKMMGVHHATDLELKSFVHLWRVIGYVLGIEDRFNICRESVTETKEICNLLIEKVFRSALEKPGEDFDKMSKALLNGMWAMNPVLEYDVFLLYLHMTLDNDPSSNSRTDDYKKLKWQKKFKLYCISLSLWSLQFDIFRNIFNYIQIVSLWLMANCPFLAYYRFGIANSHIKIS